MEILDNANAPFTFCVDLENTGKYRFSYSSLGGSVWWYFICILRANISNSE